MNTKECKHCHQVKPLSEFHRRYDSKDGHYSWCKECTNKRMKEWRDANPEKVREYNRRGYVLNNERRRAYGRYYYETHKEQYAEYYRKRQKKNRRSA